MPLDRHQQIARVWNWLPAFRAAAEYESLQRASLAIGVSASALSRSIKLLEDNLGVALFIRSPGGLALTGHGSKLLAATRDAMRRVHDALPEVRPNRLRGGATGPALQRLLSDAAVDALGNWGLAFVDIRADNASEALLCGDLDVVLAHSALEAAGVRVEVLPAMKFVLALPPGGSRARVAGLDAEGPTDAVPDVTAANIDQLVALGDRLSIAVHAPAHAIPPGWAVLEDRGLRPVFAIFRDYAEPPAFVAALGAALRARLRS